VPKFWLYTQSWPDPSVNFEEAESERANGFHHAPPTEISRPHTGRDRGLCGYTSRGGQAVNTRECKHASARTANAEGLRFNS